LGVELGHRRKLQKEIANTKRAAQEQTILDTISRNQLLTQTPYQALEPPASTSTKRRYRHHPKPDPNAPERPYSAYVLFSNDVREQLMDENYSFTEISRQVGLRWQTLTPQQKEYWKQKAVIPWEKHKADTVAYQKTGNYQEYLKYLDDFKIAQAAKSSNGRRQKSRQPSTTQSLHAPLGAGLTSPNYGSTPSPSAGLMELPQLKSSSSAFQGTKMPISQLRRTGHVEGSTAGGSRRQRSKQACESCRLKKTKCDGERPTCGNCVETEGDCHYADGKRDTEKKYVIDESGGNEVETDDEIRKAIQRNVQESECL